VNTLARYIICEISDNSFEPNYIPTDISQYHVRKAARGILVHEGKAALLNVSKKNYHKLPGGGTEKGETNEEAFKREVLEETGCKCKIKEENPVTIEYRDKERLVQISYIFLAEVEGEIGQPNFEQNEIDEGFQLEWLPIEEVGQVLSKDNPLDWESKFIHLRDKEIFKFYQNQLSDSNT